MEELGKRLTCDRCGQRVFRKKTGEGETDGGFTRWNTFEEAEGWIYWHDLNQTLCPGCSAHYERLIQDFKNFPKTEGK